MTVSPHVRKLEARDLAAFRNTWEDGLRRFPDAFLLTPEEARAIPDQRIQQDLDAGIHWGVELRSAEQESALIAIASLRQGGPQRLRHAADLGPFYVRPEWQGKGIGRQLLAKMLASAREKGLLQAELCVDQENKAAIALYQAAGFRPFGLRPRSVIVACSARHDMMMLCPLDAALDGAKITKRAAAALR